MTIFHFDFYGFQITKYENLFHFHNFPLIIVCFNLFGWTHFDRLRIKWAMFSHSVKPLFRNWLRFEVDQNNSGLKIKLILRNKSLKHIFDEKTVEELYLGMVVSPYPYIPYSHFCLYPGPTT